MSLILYPSVNTVMGFLMEDTLASRVKMVPWFHLIKGSVQFVPRGVEDVPVA